MNYNTKNSTIELAGALSTIKFATVAKRRRKRANLHKKAVSPVLIGNTVARTGDVTKWLGNVSSKFNLQKPAKWLDNKGALLRQYGEQTAQTNNILRRADNIEAAKGELADINKILSNKRINKDTSDLAELTDRLNWLKGDIKSQSALLAQGNANPANKLTGLGAKIEGFNRSGVGEIANTTGKGLKKTLLGLGAAIPSIYQYMLLGSMFMPALSGLFGGSNRD